MRGLRFIAPALCALLLGAQAATAQEATLLSPTEPPAWTVPTPNAERPLTHDELLAVRGELGLDPDTLLTLVADTVIQRSPPPRGAEIGRRTEPGLGALRREGAYPGDPVVEASSALRSRYPNDASDIEGLLAFYVTTDDMNLRGHVATPAGGYLTPIEPEALALAAELPAGALIVARGWLSNLSASEPCPALPKELRGGRLGGGSPFADCPRGWLTSDPVTETLAGDPLTPAQHAIRVQHGAASYIWQRFERGEQRESTYLLRHVRNPLANGEPAMGWEVVGLVDPVSIPEAPSALADASRPTGLDWRPVQERQPPSDTAGGDWSGGPIQTTAWRGGFASVHQGRDRVLSSWVSADGVEWRSAALPRGIRQVSALLRLGDGLAIIADSDHTGEWEVSDWRFEVWRSDDGLVWRQVGRQRVETPARLADQADGYYRIVQGFWSLGDQIVGYETYTTYRCCGRSGWAVVAASRDDAPVTFAWTSRNGVSWDRHRVTGLNAADGWFFRTRIASGDGELFALAGDAGDLIDRSTDGVHWQTIGRQPRYVESYAPMLFERVQGGFVLAGVSQEPQGPDEAWQDQAVIWYSPDADRWEETARPDTGEPGGPGGPRAMASVGDTVVVAGGDPGVPDYDSDPPWLLVSEDGGRTWAESLAWTAGQEWCLSGLTSKGPRILLDVACPTPDAASGYLVTVDVPEEPRPSAAPASVVGSPLEALGCDTQLSPSSARDGWDGIAGFETPHEALSVVLEGGEMIPREGYEVLERDATRVLYGYHNGDEVKSAVRVISLDGEGGEWTPESLAYCELSELGNAVMGPGVWLWTNRAGHTIREIRGPEYCRHSMRILYLTEPGKPLNRRHTRAYVRDAGGEMEDVWKAQYLRGTVLPPRARFTGYRRDGAELWMTPDGDAVYVVRRSSVEQWPRVPVGVGCT